MDHQPILVWRFYDAPKDYLELSDNGGDEDWLAFVPDSFGYQTPSWLAEGTRFGSCSVSHHKVKGGTIHIGAHA